MLAEKPRVSNPESKLGRKPSENDAKQDVLVNLKEGGGCLFEAGGWMDSRWTRPPDLLLAPPSIETPHHNVLVFKRTILLSLLGHLTYLITSCVRRLPYMLPTSVVPSCPTS